MRKNGSSDRETLLKFEAEGQEFEKILRSLEQLIQTVKGQQLLVTECFSNFSCMFLNANNFFQFEF